MPSSHPCHKKKRQEGPGGLSPAHTWTQSLHTQDGHKAGPRAALGSSGSRLRGATTLAPRQPVPGRVPPGAQASHQAAKPFSASGINGPSRSCQSPGGQHLATSADRWPLGRGLRWRPDAARGISQSQLQGQWRAGDLEGKGSGDGGGAHWVPRAPVGAGRHLAETAPKGVTELTVQMGLSPVLVAGATRVPWWEFQVPLSISGGVSLPPFLPLLLPFCFSRRKLAGQVDRATVKTLSFYWWEKPRSRGRRDSRPAHLHLSESGPRSAKRGQDRHLPGQPRGDRCPL